MFYKIHTSSLVLPLTLKGEETEAYRGYVSFLSPQARKWQRGDFIQGVGGWGLGVGV